MPLLIHPVAMPYRLAGEGDATIHALRIDAVASTPTAAIATAQALAVAVASQRHPGQQATVLVDRTKVGAPGAAIGGLYGYVLGTGSHVPNLVFPARMEQGAGRLLADTMEGLDHHQVHTVLLDCYLLAYVDTSTLAALIAHAERLRLRLFRVPAQILKVLDIVGMRRQLRIFASMHEALGDVVADHRLPVQREPY